MHNVGKASNQSVRLSPLLRKEYLTNQIQIKLLLRTFKVELSLSTVLSLTGFQSFDSVSWEKNYLVRVFPTALLQSKGTWLGQEKELSAHVWTSCAACANEEEDMKQTKKTER